MCGAIDTDVLIDEVRKLFDQPRAPRVARARIGRLGDEIDHLRRLVKADIEIAGLIAAAIGRSRPRGVRWSMARDKCFAEITRPHMVASRNSNLSPVIKTGSPRVASKSHNN